MVVCCVVGCHNTRENTRKKGVKFYKFPNRPYEQERRFKWILAVNRENEHFVGGQSSNIGKYPAYVPSIFPELYEKRSNADADLRLFERRGKRRKLSEFSEAAASGTRTSLADAPLLSRLSEIAATKSEGCQTSLSYDDSFFEFSSNFEGGNASTQCTINSGVENVTAESRAHESPYLRHRRKR